MAKLSRKEKELKAREQLILDTARRLLIEHGYLGLKMDQIAFETEYSKGTIYQHFVSKEDVIMALATETLEKRVEMFKKAAEFNGRTREKMAAIGMASELFMHKYPEHFRIEQLIRTDSLREKAAPERQEKLLLFEQQCIGTLTKVIQEAIDQGDLVLPETLSPEQLTFGLWALSVGGQSLMTTGMHLDELGIKTPYEAVITNAQMMLDGVGWHPLTSEWDYMKTSLRIAEEVFPEAIPALST